MSYNKVVPSPEFLRRVKPLLKKYKSLKSELLEFEDFLLKNPNAGDSLGKDSYKIRISILSKGKGKRGGARIIYLLSPRSKNIFLITIFDKSEADNVADDYIQQVTKELYNKFKF